MLDEKIMINDYGKKIEHHNLKKVLTTIFKY